MPGLLKARNVVVPPKAAATESWKKRSGSASVATRVWVWTSTTPGQHQQPGRVDDLAAPTAATPRGPAARCADDPCRPSHARRSAHRARAVRAVTTVAAAARCEDRSPRSRRPPLSASTISISWAPSQRQRRPTSLSRSCQPSSGTMVAKWLAASGPTFEAVVQAPYGKKISHSLMPPG